MRAVRLTWTRAAVALAVLLLAGAALVAWLNVRGVALAYQRLAACDLVGRRTDRLRRRVGQVQRREVVGDLVQVLVRHLLDEVRHRRIGAPAAAEVVQLVVQVARRLARDAREEALLRRAPFLAVAGAAGLHALGQGVGDRGRRTGHCSGHGRQGDERDAATKQVPA